MTEIICEHCNSITVQFKTVYIEGVSFSGHLGCMDDLVEFHKEGRHTLEDYIRELKK